MARLFLGKASHWVLIILLTGTLYSVGLTRLHVTHFVSFIALLVLAVFGLIVVLRRTTAVGDKTKRN